MKKELISY